MPILLAAGVELRCPHCHRWHQIQPSHLRDVPGEHYLYWTCVNGLRYFAGTPSTEARYPARLPTPPAPESRAPR